MSEAFQDRTEKPTPKKRREARDKGQVARSRDLTLAVSLIGTTAALGLAGPFMLRRLASLVTDGLAAAGLRARQDLGAGDLSALTAAYGRALALLVGPIACVAAGAAVAATAAQGGIRVAPAALRLDWARLSPAAGFRRLMPSRSGLDLVRAVIAVAALVAVCWSIGGRLAVGAAHYGVQRWRLTQALRMTKREVKEEARLSEGNPEIKARVRKVQREMLRRRMLQATAKATVVITNPTHYAVALEYRREQHAAPIVVAKGRDLMAQRIRGIARAHGVPIVENPPLARALHQGAEVGEAIPAALFGAVAEVLAYLIRIKQLML